LNSIKIKM